MYNYLTRLREKTIFGLWAWYTLWQGGSYAWSDILFADPIMSIFQNLHWATVVGTINPRIVDKSFLHLGVPRNNVYLQGFAILSDRTRREHRDSLNEAYPSWNRRRGTYLTGSEGSRQEQFHYERATPSWTLPADFSTSADNKVRSTPIVPKVTTGYDRYMSFDDLKLFAYRISPRVGSVFHRSTTLSRYTVCTLAALDVSENKISYVLKDITAQLYPSSRRMKCSSVRVIISRSVTEGGAPYTEVQLEHGVISLSYGSLITYMHFPDYVRSQDHLDSTDRYAKEIETQSLMNAFRRFFSIENMRPALYHTQGQALSKVMLDLDRNFENLIESTSFITDLHSTVDKGSQDLITFLSNHPSKVARAAALARLLSSVTLASTFGIAPSIEALQGLMSGYVAPISGEAEMNFEFSSLSELPETLRDLLTKAISVFGSEDVDLGRIKFRSEVWTTPSYQQLVQTLYNENLILGQGLVPSPSGIWNATKMSFVVDWFVPIGRMIDDHQAYMLSFTLPFRIGHSVSITLFLDDGREINHFMRSCQVNYPLDPPGDSWLVPSGLPPISIALGTSVLLGLCNL